MNRKEVEEVVVSVGIAMVPSQNNRLQEATTTAGRGITTTKSLIIIFLRITLSKKTKPRNQIIGVNKLGLRKIFKSTSSMNDFIVLSI